MSRPAAALTGAAALLFVIGWSVAADDAPTNPPTPAPAAEPAVAPAEAPPAVTEPVPAPLLPDAALLKSSQILREGPIGREANTVTYLDLIDAGQASPAQVNDFATYLGRRGALRLALQYQQHAVKLDRQNTTIWLNLGTLQSGLGQLSSAESSYKKAIDIDPNNALAHYNLGAIYDVKKNYDAAIEEYRRALVLDPNLGDARKNPQVVNNDHLLAVKLQIYQNQAGAFGLPLVQMQKPETPAPPPPDKK